MNSDHINNENINDSDINIGEDDLHIGKGYSGISMSNNAAEAYEEGRMPLSKWKKGMLIDKIDENRKLVKCDYELLKRQPLEVLKKLLLSSSGEYHHMADIKRYHRNEKKKVPKRIIR